MREGAAPSVGAAALQGAWGSPNSGWGRAGTGSNAGGRTPQQPHSRGHGGVVVACIHARLCVCVVLHTHRAQKTKVRKGALSHTR